MNIDTALEKIYSLKQFHVKLGLENITELLNHINNPQDSIKTIHVAGSNGKGSTCSYLASILKEHGYRVGLYTSPHFVRFNERIRINGVEISDDDIIQFLEINKNYIDKSKPTFFEITTALAFNYFNECNVDYAIIETGLGGRLDATNIITPLASVITSISLEHSHILGETLAEIAFEKAGIIKEQVPVLVGDLPLEALQRIEKVAGEKKTEIIRSNDFISFYKNILQIKLGSNDYEFPGVGLKGKYQFKNAGLAIKTVETVLGSIDSKIIQKGLDSIIANTGIQGRYERYGSEQNIIFDAAHNIEGIEMFLDEFNSEYQNYKNCSLIFGAMRDKKIDEMLFLLKPYFNQIYVTSTAYERSATAEEIKHISDENNIDVIVIDKPEDIISSYEKNKSDECLVILGSIYLIGEIKKKISM
jgi:dihydrofolate synthase / folylpolyglutamate synthase